MNRFWLAISVAALVSGCAKLQQDPLGDRPGIIQNTKPPGQKPEPQKPIDTEWLVIEGPESYSFMEERTDHVEFTVRTLDPDYVGRLDILNMASFPGAAFDPATGSFSWTPAKGFVIDGTPREVELKVRASAKSRAGDQTSFVRTKSVHLIVNRKLVIPELKSVTTTAALVREGASAQVTVVVQDPDGGPNPGEGPVLLFLPPVATSQATKSLAPFAVINSVAVDFPNRRWTFDVRINLVGAEVTTSSALGGLMFKAVNRFNRFTAEVPFTLKTYTQLTDLLSTWQTTDVPEIIAGTEATIPFLLFDPKGEALVDGWTNYTPTGANFRCQASRVGMTSCTLRWTAPDSMAGTQQMIYVSARGTNIDTSDTQSLSKTFTYYVNVKARPVQPPPPAGPAPAPTPLPAPRPRPSVIPVVEGVGR